MPGVEHRERCDEMELSGSAARAIAKFLEGDDTELGNILVSFLGQLIGVARWRLVSVPHTDEEAAAMSALRTFIRGVRAGKFSAVGYDLRLMSWGDGSGALTSGNNLVIVGTDNSGGLHIRIFDPGGTRVIDNDETKLPDTEAAAILALKQQIPALLAKQVLSDAEKHQVITKATSIAGHTLAVRTTEDLRKLLVTITDRKAIKQIRTVQAAKAGDGGVYNEPADGLDGQAQEDSPVERAIAREWREYMEKHKLRQAAELVAARCTYREIAKEMSITEAQARRLITVVRKRTFAFFGLTENE